LVAIATVHRFSQEFTTNGQFAVVIGAICCCALFAVSSTSDRTSTHSSTNPFEVRLDELSKYVWSRNADGTIEYLSRLRSVNYDCDRGAKWVFDRRTWSARPANTQAPDKVQSLQKNTGQRRFLNKAGNSPDMRLADIHKPPEDSVSHRSRKIPEIHRRRLHHYRSGLLDNRRSLYRSLHNDYHWAWLSISLLNRQPRLRICARTVPPAVPA
jgi:hypothetical protein